MSAPPRAEAASQFRCLACGVTEGRRELVKAGMELWRCAACALVQRHPLPSAAEIDAMYVEEAHYGDELRRSEGEFLARERGVLAALADQGASGPLLDVGAGAGYILRAARELGWEAVGIELSRPNAARVAAELGVAVHAVDIAAAPLESGTFGLVTFSHSLEHLVDPVGALRRARELLAPGGRVHVAVPHWDAAKRRVAGAGIPWIYPHHLAYFTRVTLVRALEQAGFERARATTGPMLGRDYPFLIATLERARLDGAVRAFLKLGDRPLASLIGDDIRVDCAVWRLRATLALAHGLLAAWPDRWLGRLGLGDELRVTAVRG